MSIQTMLVSLSQAFLTTLAIFFLTLLGSLPLGLVVYFARKSRFSPLRWLTKVYIAIMRGTPLMLQVMVVYYGPSLLLGMTLPRNWRFAAVIVAFVINYAAYFAEIYRGGIESISAGQYEAAQVLGYRKGQTFFRIILPQMVKRVLPSVTNEVITLVKDTSLASVIGTDYTCMEALPGALQLLETQPEPGRKLRIGVQDGIAPISSSRDDGSFGGLIPDLAQLVAEKLGWTFEYMVINSDNVAAELGSGNIDCAWMAASFSGSSSSVSLSPGWLRNTQELVVRSDSRYTRKNSLKGKVVGITDATALAALKESGMDAKVGSVWYYDDLSACFAALAAGDCDAVVIDGIVSGYYM